jgi:Bax protein
MLKLIEKISFLQGLIALCVLWSLIIFIIESDGSFETAEVPDFKSMESVSAKKQAFFTYFGALAEEENQRILSIREKIQSGVKQSTLEKLAKKYRLDINDPASEKDFADLLSRVDVVPSSLVLAQAAIESAWGTSRFATEGYNFFGQWCFSKGCGMVPSSRNEGANHEVRTFDSPKESVQAYFLNINSHPSYDMVRQLRLDARNESKPVHGCVLAAGLGSYSERGQHYIDEIRLMIRVNDLSPHGKGPCAAAPKVVEEAEDQGSDTAGLADSSVKNDDAEQDQQDQSKASGDAAKQ